MGKIYNRSSPSSKQQFTVNIVWSNLLKNITMDTGQTPTTKFHLQHLVPQVSRDNFRRKHIIYKTYSRHNTTILTSITANKIRILSHMCESQWKCWNHRLEHFNMCVHRPWHFRPIAPKENVSFHIHMILELNWYYFICSKFTWGHKTKQIILKLKKIF